MKKRDNSHGQIGKRLDTYQTLQTLSVLCNAQLRSVEASCIYFSKIRSNLGMLYSSMKKQIIRFKICEYIQ